MCIQEKELIKEIVDKLSRLGVKKGDTIFVHSSLKSFGIEDISPKSVIDALLETVGEEGTVLFPAFSYATVTRENPHFDYIQTKSCVGYLAEFFRTKYEGTVRSLHPTHSVSAIGKRAEWFVAKHEFDDTPCGKNSPLNKLSQTGGKIIFLGCSYASNTSMHAVEEYVTPPFLLGDLVKYTMTKADGTSFEQKVYRHNFAPSKKVQRYDRLKDLMPRNGVWEGKIFNANVVVYDVKTMWSVALDKYLDDNCYFVDNV